MSKHFPMTWDNYVHVSGFPLDHKNIRSGFNTMFTGYKSMKRVTDDAINFIAPKPNNALQYTVIVVLHEFNEVSNRF